MAVVVGTGVGDGVGGAGVEVGGWSVGTAVAVGIGDAVAVEVGDSVAVGEEPQAASAIRIATPASRNPMSRSFRCNVPVCYRRHAVSKIVTRRGRVGWDWVGAGA